MNEHKRVKHGEMPGDVPRRYLIALREANRYSRPIITRLGQILDEAMQKRLRRYLRDKGRKVQRRRDRRATEEPT